MKGSTEMNIRMELVHHRSTDVSEKRIASMFRIEDRCDLFIRNVGIIPTYNITRRHNPEDHNP
jgi:hypothetical protein